MSKRTKTGKAERTAGSGDNPGDAITDAEWLEQFAESAHRAIAEAYAEAQVLLAGADDEQVADKQVDGRHDATGRSA